MDLTLKARIVSEKILSRKPDFGVGMAVAGWIRFGKALLLH